jgi:sugar lactone lactonase YvrE
MDETLQHERLDGRSKRRHRARLDTLPDGAMIAIDGEAFAVRGNALLRWTPKGYVTGERRMRGATANLLTPPSIVAVLKAGYRPGWHASAAKL